ncbi:MAG TPA: hypothetical protein VD973_11635 [Symbiobacteriaceae bacterium]|nr:hypothetical protein [Symbiobacteriaceae bacterium]
MRRFALLLALLVAVGCASQPSKVDHPKVSEEAAVKAARSADPQSQVEGWAGWQVRYEPPAWVVEAVHYDGEQLLFYVAGGEYPPKLLRTDRAPGKYVSRDKAAEAALTGTQSLAVKGVQFAAQYPLEHAGNGAKGAVWVVELISTPDQRPQGKAIVDAMSGKVLSVSNAPSGQ